MILLKVFMPAFAAAALAAGQPARAEAITSAYTTLDLEKCKRIDVVREHQSARWRCAGYKGIPLFVQNGDDRHDVDAGLEDGDEHWGSAFDFPGRTVEWRMAGGKPFAIIYRLTSEGDGAPRSSMLIVETIGRGKPGCRLAAIPARLAGANERARRAADKAAGGSAPCLAHSAP